MKKAASIGQTPFDGLTPVRELWVSTAGSASGDGSQSSPFNTIQAAVNAATPGTAIMVEPGTYSENVLFKQDQSGTATAPIWLESAGPPQSAHIVAPDPTNAAVGGGGVKNIVIENLWISGGRNGIQISEDGYDYSKPIANVVVEGNRVDGAAEDGIKADGGVGVYVLDNTIVGGGQQGVDFLAINNSVIAGNDISDVTGSDGLFVKGGSTNDVIAGNYLHDLAQDGIGVGEHMSSLEFFRPGYTSYEASNIQVIGNDIVDVAGRPLVFQGATHSQAIDNHIGASLGGYSSVAVIPDVLDSGQVFNSSGITVEDDAFDSGKSLLMVAPGQGQKLTFHDNTTNALQTIGDASANVIVGSKGADLIWGGGGADTLTGGGGADSFIYVNAGEGGDLITDFQRGLDHLDLRPMAAIFPGLAVSFQDTPQGLQVIADYEGTPSGRHEILATLEGVHGTGLTAGVDYLI